MLFDVVITPFQPLPDCTIHTEQYGLFDCEALKKKIISMRAYFAIILINFIFIITTTCYFIYRVLKAKWTNSDTISQENISKQWQAYSLKKRGLFGSVLGAIGHLIFSTTILFYQTILEPWTCNVYLWGPMVGLYIWTYAIIWRSLRLYVLIRMNNLQQRFLKTPDRMNDARRDQSDADYKYFMKQKDRLNVSNSFHVYIFLITIVIIILIITLAEKLSISAHSIPHCSLEWGNNMILAAVVFFFIVVVPPIGWFLKDYEDAHGIRLEIWVTLIVGVPCFVIFIIWQCVFDSPNVDPDSVRNVWGPGNWIIFVTTTNHIMSIVLPLFKALSIQNKPTATLSKAKSAAIKKAKKACRLSVLVPPHPEPLLPSQTTSAFNSSLPSRRRNLLKLTTESLEKNLQDPNMRAILREWAIKDFSVENVLFYECYLNLVQKVQLYRTKDALDKIERSPVIESTATEKESYATTTTTTATTTVPQSVLKLNNNNNNNNNNTAKKLKERTNSYTPFSSNSVYTIIQCDTYSSPTKDDITAIFSLEEIPEFFDFYETFIKDNAPLQVNISHKAREKLDQVFQPLEPSGVGKSNQRQQHERDASPYFFPPALDDSISFMTNQNTIYEGKDVINPPASYQPVHETITPYFPNILKDEMEKYSTLSIHSPLHTPLDMSVLTSIQISLCLFEAARKEVFYNIFAGVYPKIVDAYDS